MKTYKRHRKKAAAAAGLGWDAGSTMRAINWLGLSMQGSNNSPGSVHANEQVCCGR
jgi:hypothetical protein